MSSEKTTVCKRFLIAGVFFTLFVRSSVAGEADVSLKYTNALLPSELTATAWGTEFSLKPAPEFSMVVQKVDTPKGKSFKFGDFIPDKSSFKQERQNCFARFHIMVEGGRITVETTVKAAEDRFLWTISVDNKSAIPVMKVTFPILKHLSFSAGGKNDELVWPFQSTLKSYSMIIKNPAEKRPPGPATYPRSSLNFVDLSGNNRGVTVIGPKELIYREFTCGKGATPGTVDIDATVIDSIMPGRKAIYEFIIYPHSGDWRRGANFYREVFHKRFGGPNYPEWAKRSNGYYAISWIGGSSPYDAEMRHAINETWRLGLEHLQIWGQTGQSACPLYPLPDPVKGGEETFTKTIREIAAAGLKPGAYFWPNGMGEFELLAGSFRGVKWSSYPEKLRPPSWDWVVRYSQYSTPEREKPQKDDNLAVILARAKVKTLEEAEAKKLVPQVLHKMMFHSKAYQDWLLFWIDRYVCSYEIRVPYLDEFGLRPKYQEYNPYMKCWGDGTEGIYRYSFLQMLNHKFRPEYPDFVPMMEGTIDCYNTQAMALISNFRTGIMPIYRYIFPELILHEGMSNGHWNKSIPSISNAYLDGNRFDLLEKWIPSEVDRMVWLRDSLIRFVSDAAYLGPSEVKLNSDKVQVTLLDASRSHGIKLLNFRNVNNEKGVKAALPEYLTQNTAGAFLLPLYGKMTWLKKFDSVEIPPCTVSTLLICGNNIPDAAAVIPIVFPEMAEDSMHFKFQLINLSGKIRQIKREVRFAADGKVAIPETNMEIPPWNIVSGECILPFREFGDKAQRLWISFTGTEGVAYQLRRLYEPPFEDTGFEWDNKSRPLSTDMALSGKSSLALEAGKNIMPLLKPVPNAVNIISVYACSINGGIPSIVIYERKTEKTTPMKSISKKKRGAWTKYEAVLPVGNNVNYRISFRNQGKTGMVYYDELTLSAKQQNANN